MVDGERRHRQIHPPRRATVIWTKAEYITREAFRVESEETTFGMGLRLRRPVYDVRRRGQQKRRELAY